jgi:nucleoside-diphosphate-sugar epimerase
MRVLVTGSSGQLGREILRQLADEHETVGLDVVAGPATDVIGSVADRDVVRALVSNVDAVIHTGSLHAPDVPRWSRRDFVDTNVSGTLHLLEAAAASGLRRFVYTSTTSIYGHALVPTDRAVWVTEELTPRPRDIYDITKRTAEDLCRDVAAAADLPTVCLRASRFFAEDARTTAIYRLYRGADVRDIAAAHVLALAADVAPFGVLNVAARSPFLASETPELLRDAGTVIRRHFPDAEAVFARKGWRLPESIDRVYVTAMAERVLGYQPRWNFRELLDDMGRTP